MARRFNAEEVVDLPDEDHQRDAAGESVITGCRDEIDHRPEPEQAERQQDQSRQQARDPQTVQAVPRHDHDKHRRHRPGSCR